MNILCTYLKWKTGIIEIVKNFMGELSTDFNDINMDIVKSIMTNIVKPLSHICNTSFISGIFPDNMKIAKVVPLCKAGENNLFTNYRPVSLLSQFSKILEKLFSKRLDKYIDNSSLLNSVSSRIQKGHGATNHWRHLIMPAGHPVDSVGHYQHPPPPQFRVQTESVKYHRQLLPLCTQAVIIRYCVIGVNARQQ